MKIYKGKTPGKTLAEPSLKDMPVVIDPSIADGVIYILNDKTMYSELESIVDDSTQETTYTKMYHTNYGGSWKVEVDPTTHKPYKWYQRLWHWLNRNY